MMSVQFGSGSLTNSSQSKVSSEQATLLGRLSLFGEEVSGLLSLLTDLEARLQPVLVPQTSTNAAGGTSPGQPRPAMSPVLEKIGDLQNLVGVGSERIRILLRRLEC